VVYLPLSPIILSNTWWALSSIFLSLLIVLLYFKTLRIWSRLSRRAQSWLYFNIFKNKYQIKVKRSCKNNLILNKVFAILQISAGRWVVKLQLAVWIVTTQTIQKLLWLNLLLLKIVHRLLVVSIYVCNINSE
jgi:hypothetical protein